MIARHGTAGLTSPALPSRPPAALRGLAALVGLFPWRSLPFFGAILAWIAGSLVRVRRGHVEGAMRAASIDAPSREANAMYRSLGTSAFELLWLGSKRRAASGAATQRVVMGEVSAARWEAAVAAGRGVVVAASHTGNWDLTACAMAQRIELLVVTKRLRVGWLDGFWQGARAAQGVRLTEARGALAKAREVLRRSGAVAMMIDQVPDDPRRANRVPFLGRPVLTDRAPAVLSAATGAPLVVSAARRAGRGQHEVHVLDVLVPPERPTRAWIDAATAAATQALDGFVREHPSEWLWLHQRWKSADDVDRDRRAGASKIRTK